MHAYQPERLKEFTTSNNPAMQTVMAYPGLCAGAALSLVVMGSIFVNAVWYQPGKHPAPMFTTRTETLVKSLTAQKSTKEPKATATKTATVAPKKEPEKEIGSTSSQEVLREVQTALSVRGYYSGKLDGVYGSRTKKAILAFQSDQSLPADGKVNVRLLTQVLMSASARPAEVPVPKPVEVATKKPTIKKVAVSNPEPETVASLPDGLVAQIQSGLKTYGYDDIKVDGKMGQQTATAIQRFQLDYGMKITGEPSDHVLRKLKDIGAFKSG